MCVKNAASAVPDVFVHITGIFRMDNRIVFLHHKFGMRIETLSSVSVFHTLNAAPALLIHYAMNLFTIRIFNCWISVSGSKILIALLWCVLLFHIRWPMLFDVCTF